MVEPIYLQTVPDSIPDGIQPQDIIDWDSTDASEHSSNGEAPQQNGDVNEQHEGNDVGYDTAPFGVQRYEEILSFGLGLLIAQKKSPLKL